MKKVKEFMTRDLTSVTEDTSLKDVAELLSIRALSGVPVVNQDNVVTGFISEKDIIISIFPERFRMENADVIGISNLSRLVTKMSQVGQAKVKDYMNTNIFCVTEDSQASDVAEIMINRDIMRLPVVKDRKLVGIVDRSSLSRIMLEEGTLE